MTITADPMAAFRRGLGIPPDGQGTRSFPTPLDLACALDARFRRTPALELINDALVWAESTLDARLIIVMPPQEGKSTLVTRYCTTWALQRDPARRCAITSYADRLARRWGRRIRNDITSHAGQGGMLDLGLRMAADQRAADEWELSASEGGVYTAGVGGSLVGRPVDWLVIDDPVKGRKEAESKVVSDDVWDWWEGSASSRLAPGAPVILVLTRWHHADLAGRLMDEQPGVWRLVHIPAQADPEVLTPDPLDREWGEFMQSARGRTLEQWAKRKVDAGEEWEPLYQGNPRPPGGSVFDVTKLQYWLPGRDERGEGIACGQTIWPLQSCFRFGTVDTATSTATSADFTVACAWAVPPDGSLVLLDVVRDRLPPHKQIDVVRPLVQRWQLSRVKVEPNLKSTELVRAAVREGLPVEDVIADRSKELRATLAAKAVDRAHVWFPARHRLLDVIVREVDQFPNGRHDDFVDNLAYAENTRFEEWVPPSAPPRTRPPERPADMGLDVAIADPMRQEW